MLDDCPFCHHEDATVYREKQKLRDDGYRDIYICNECLTMYPKPRMNKEEIKAYHEKLYSKKTYDNPTTSLISGNWLNRLLQPRGSYLNLMNYIKKHVSVGSTLDIGTYTGQFCYLLKEAGYASYGLEMDGGAVDVAREKGLNVYKGAFPDEMPQEVLRERYSFVSLKEMIYYIVDLKRAMAKLKDILVPGGKVLIKCHQGKSRYYDTHENSYFSRYSDYVQGIPTVESLKFILERAGFDIIRLFGSYSAPAFAPWEFSGKGKITKAAGMLINKCCLSTMSGINKADQIVIFGKLK
ncbi:MAG: methyltransferase domain-containing protein [Planctomycetes bacterium]|nr:methyltransferase domain-containing protein [Planctomycetota bacterium]